jgi:hypothetical protein
MQPRITAGATVFVAPERSAWDTRQAVKAAIRMAQPKRRLTVTHDVDYYGVFLDQLLDDPGGVLETAFQLGDKIVGEEDGAWRCAAFWSLGGDGLGVLLHRDRDKLFFSCLPLMPEETAEQEHAVAVALGRLAREADGMPIRLEKDIREGMHKLTDILDVLAEGMEV